MALRVLVVEDDEEDYQLTRKLLRGNAETTFEVVWAESFEAALELLRHPFDACLVDYQLGARDGLELVAAAVAAGFSAPMIMLTGQGGHDVDVRAMKLGAADYLVKNQITPQLMERVIRHAIERKLARDAHLQDELALRKSEEQYRQIVEETTDGIIKMDLGEQIVFANGRFAEMLGYEPREMIGANAFDLMSSSAQLIARRSIAERPQGFWGAVDTTFRHRNGTDIWCNVTGVPLRDAEGVHVGNLGVVRDETERRKLHSQLMVSDRMASVGTLAAGVAHEINNPLAAIIANLDFIAETITNFGRGVVDPIVNPKKWLHTELDEPIHDARDAAQRVRFIVRDLKLFSRSPLEDSRSTVNVKSVMESSIRMAWNEIRHRARLIKTYDPMVVAQANEARLGQVFLNLLVNAAQALPDGRADHNEIHVITRIDGKCAVIEVRDTGPGIAPEIVDRIFDAFFTTKDVNVGTGLGLAICQRLVSDMRGELTVESELGKGSTFRVRVPIARANPPSRPPRRPTSTILPMRRGRIMVIDDEISVVRGIVRVLSKEHDVVPLHGARAALARCVAGEKFDLILCDLMMPDMGGMELHRELSQISPDQADRMIFVTGGAFSNEARQFLEDTLKEHLEKPFDSVNLRAIVRRYLR